jgi:hypothetical protein
VAFLTGTPISNSVAEMYLVLRNLAPTELRDMGLEHFDAFRSMFVSASAEFEPNEYGGVKEVTRLGREWENMRALMDLYYSVTDAVSLDDIKADFAAQNPGEQYPVPPVKSQVESGKDREAVAVKPDVAQVQILSQIVADFEGLEGISDPKERNAERLRLMDRARKVSLDARAVDPATDVPAGSGKIGAVVDNVHRLWEATTEDRGTQLVFLDRSVPKGQGDEKLVAEYDAAMAKLEQARAEADEDAERRALDALEKFDERDIEARRIALQGGWNAYDEIKRQLVAKGIPEAEIRFIQEAKDDEAKYEMIQAVNRGDVRVLIGSTPRMGAGTNAQERLVGLHHVDVTWKPSDIEQREGRIIRQGNSLLEKYGHDGFQVEILAYVTEMTIDAKMWDLNSQKLKAINGIRKYDGSFRMEFEDEESASMAEMAALATGNPLMVERVVLAAELGKMDLKRRGFNNRRNAMRGQLRSAQRILATAERDIAQAETFEQVLREARAQAAARSAERTVEIEGQTFTSAADALDGAGAMIAEQRGDNEKARWKLTVGGVKVTTVADLNERIDNAFGTPGFEFDIDGERHIRLWHAATALDEKFKREVAAQAGNEQVTIDGMTLNGIPLEVDLYEGAYNRAGEKTLDVNLVHKGEVIYYTSRTIGRDASMPNVFRMRLDALHENATPEAMIRRADNLRKDMAGAEKQAPTLEAEIAKEWPEQEEYQRKSERLQEVIKILTDSSDTERLSRSEMRAPLGRLRPEQEEAAAAEITKEVERTGLAGVVTARVVRGLIGAMNQPILGRALGAAIDVNAAAADKLGVVRHELIHVLRDAALWGRPYGLFKPDEWRTLVRAARGDKARMQAIADAYPDLTEPQRIEESVAEMYREWMGARQAAGPLAKLFQKMRDFFQAAARALGVVEAAGAAEIMGRISGGDVGRRGEPEAGGESPRELRFLNRLPRARDVAALDANESEIIGKLSKASSNALTDAMGGASQRYNLLAMVPGRALFQELGKHLPSSRRYLRTKEEMDALRNEWHVKTDETAREWQQAIAKAAGGTILSRGRRKAVARELADLMHDATIAGLDPAERFRAPQRQSDMRDEDYRNAVDESRRRYAELRERWEALPDAMKGVYRSVRDTFKKMADDVEDAVAEAAAKAMELQTERARVRRDEDLLQLRDEGLRGKALEDAEATIRRRFTTEVGRMEATKAARVRKLRMRFEENRVEEPYFPLMRWGNYFVTVRDAEGKVVSFSKFERAAKQEAFAAEMRDEGFTVEVGVIGRDMDMSRYVDPNFVADVTEILGDDAAAGGVMDAIWQRWLETLPDYSLRKSRIHRKGTPGFDGDALRAFAHQMFHGAHQLARLKYGMDLTKHIEAAAREAKVAPDPTRAGIVVNEMQQRHEWVMNPEGSPWAAAATSAAFIWYLGVSPAAAIVNLSQTTIVGAPILTAGIEGATIAKTLGHLTRALKDFAHGKGWAQTSSRLTEDERAAMEEAYRRGTLDKSQAHDIASVAESGVEYSGARERIMRPISYFFHHAERMNREVTFLAAYRMARGAGMDASSALQKASDLTWKSHFDYSNTSRPRFMQSDAAKVLFVFRNFQINMIYRLWRDVHQSINGEDEAARREARAQLIGITASMMLHAGITGTWGYALLMSLLGLFFDGGQEEAEEELKRGVIETFGPAAGILLKGVPGHITGVDLSSRIGMPELWFRSPDRQMEGQEAYLFWLEQAVGAVPSIASGVFRGLQWASEGDVWRAVETAGPKFLRDQLRTVRYLREGVTTRSGEPVVDELTPGQALAQAIGFTPAEVAERYEMNRRMRNMEQRVSMERRRALKSAYNDLKGDGRLSDRTMERIQAFNRRNPAWIITGDSIRKSVTSRQRMGDQMEAGLRITPKLDGVIRSQMAPALYQ